MKYIITFLWCACTCHISIAQLPLNVNKYVDSLSTLAQHPLPDVEKARVYFLLSEYWLTEDSALGKSYLQRGKQLTGKSAYAQALFMYYSAMALPHTGLQTAEQLYLKANTLLSGLPSKDGQAYRIRCLRKYANLQKTKDDNKKAIDILLNKAMPLASLSGDSIQIALIYHDVAISFKNMMDYQKASTYLLSAKRMLENNHSPREHLIAVYHTLSENRILMGDVEQAGPLLDSMRVLLEPYPNSLLWLDYYAGSAMQLTMTYRFDKAINATEKGIALARSLNRNYLEQRLLLQKFYALYNQKSFVKAKAVMEDLITRKEINALATNRTQMYYGMALTYAELKNMKKAYEWMQAYSLLNDSVNKNKIRKDIHSIEVKYQAAEKEKKIALLQSEKEQSAYKIKTSRLNNLLLTTVTILLLLGLGFLFYAFANNKKLSGQQELNHRQQLNDLAQQQKLAVTEAIIKGEEKERQRLARDLHDGLGGMLSGVKIKLSTYSNGRNDGTDELKNIIGQLDGSVTELRRIARNMMPESLMRFGLKTALRDLCESLSSRSTYVHFESYNMADNMLTSNQIIIFRIIQEGLSNALRHAGATEVVLQCSQNEDTLLIVIEDNGRGFDRKTLEDRTGIGISNIENRVKYLKGKLDIASSPNEGTTITIEIYVAA